MKGIVKTLLLTVLSICLFESCSGNNSTKEKLKNVDSIAKDTITLLVSCVGDNLIIIITEDSIEYGSTNFHGWPGKPVTPSISESIHWIPTRTHYKKNLRSKQKLEVDKIKLNVKRWFFDGPDCVKDGIELELYHNRKCIVYGNLEYFDKFPTDIREGIVSILGMAGIKNLNDEFNADNWYDPSLRMP